jgi:hypothetical protein
MPILSGKAKADLINSNFLDVNSNDKSIYIVLEDTLSEYGEKFLYLLEKYYNQRGVKASGAIISESKSIITENGNGTLLTISLPDYYDYPNEGVRGVKESQNASNSPYKFKSLTKMSKEGRESLKKYILSGKAKVRAVNKTIGQEKKYKRISETKKKSLIDKQVDTLIYNIKKYGIKTTRYFDDAFEEAFSDLDVAVSEQMADAMVISIVKQVNKKQ